MSCNNSNMNIIQFIFNPGQCIKNVKSSKSCPNSLTDKSIIIL